MAEHLSVILLLFMMVPIAFYFTRVLDYLLDMLFDYFADRYKICSKKNKEGS